MGYKRLTPKITYYPSVIMFHCLYSNVPWITRDGNKISMSREKVRQRVLHDYNEVYQRYFDVLINIGAIKDYIEIGGRIEFTIVKPRWLT